MAEGDTGEKIKQGMVQFGIVCYLNPSSPALRQVLLLHDRLNLGSDLLLSAINGLHLTADYSAYSFKF